MNGLLEWALEHVAEWIAAGVFLAPAFGPVQAPPPPPAIEETPVIFSIQEPELVALTRGEVYALALHVSGDPAWSAAAAPIGMCESGGEYWQTRGDAGQSIGLFSVKPRFWGPVALDDPLAQVQQVRDIWLSQQEDPRGPWWPWEACA